MTDFDKIDDYLSNRLNESDKAAFEQSLASDSSLREEVAFQQKVVTAVQKARAAQLKQMLSQVPVPSSGWSTGQMAAGVLAAGVIATGLYFYLTYEEPVAPDPIVPEVVMEPAPAEAPAEEPAEPQTSTPATTEQKKKPTTPKIKAVTPVQKPDIQVVDPSVDLNDTKEPEAEVNPSRNELTISKLEVVTTPADKKYSFHFQFAEGKLMLYGPFDTSLYEILEINGDSHAVFLFYKENYYLLDEQQKNITPLAPIRDGQLLKKLREYRNN